MQGHYVSSSNPSGIYTPSSQTMSRIGEMSNMRQAFASNQQVIGRPDYTNHEQLMHNNVAEKILNDYITEYKIHVSSADRDTGQFPSPFNMRVVFGNEQTNPAIPIKFKTIKYVNIDSLVLPRTISIDTSFINILTSVYDIYPTGTSYTTNSHTAHAANNNMTILANRRYLILKILELNTDQNLGSSIWYTRDTMLLTPDYSTGFDNVVWKPLHNSRIVNPSSSLKPISTLTLALYDENGTPLNLYDNSGNPLIGTGSTTIGGLSYLNYVSQYSSTASVSYTNGVDQVLYNLTIGAVDCEITTQPNFGR